jgi:hypothetical protein
MSTDLQGDAGQLPRQVQELIDRQAVADLIYRLGLWLDEKRFDDARSIFTEDATVEHAVGPDSPGGSARGVESVAAQARRNHDEVRTQHVFTNVLVDVDGDQPAARANLIATFVQDGDEPTSHLMMGAHYDFQVVRAPHGWRLSRVRISPTWSRGSRAGTTPVRS